MLAHHPITQKPIRIIKVDTSLHKDQKTLVWLRDQTETAGFNRWDTLTVGLEDTVKWTKILGRTPMFVCLTETSDAIQKWMRNGGPKNARLCFFSRDILSTYGLENLKKDKFTNIICIEEMNDMFPYTGMISKTGTDSNHAYTALQISLILRVSRLVGVRSEERTSSEFLTVYNKAYLKFPINVVSDSMISLPKVWLIQQYFISPKAKRAREIKTCLQKNLDCPYIDKVILMNEADLSNEWAYMNNTGKIKQEIIGTRMKYSDVIKYIYDSVPAGIHVIFSNSDIYFDGTLRELFTLNLEDRFLSLLRYEDLQDGSEPKLFGPRPDSQDSWIVSSTSVKKRNWIWPEIEFEFGRAGCDNAINVAMLKQKFLTCNPALSIRTLHLHTSGIRTYNALDCIEKPVYLYIEPTGLHDMNPVKDITKELLPFSKARSFSRKIKGNPDKVKTYCKMIQLAKAKDRFSYTYQETNMWSPVEPQNLYVFKNTFQTQSGLLYGYNNMYISNQVAIRKLWSEEQLSPIIPTIHTKTSIAVHLTRSMVSNALEYIAYYLGPVLQLREMGVKGDFWMPKTQARLMNFLQLFNWGEKTVPVVPYNIDDEVHIYSDTVYMLTPNVKVEDPTNESNTCVTNLMTRESVSALRNLLVNYIEKPCEKEVVILQDDVLLTEGCVSILERGLTDSGFIVKVVYPTRSTPDYIVNSCLGVSYCISAGYAESQSELCYWMLPKCCKIIEVQNEMKPYGNGVHVAGASSVDIWVVPVARGLPDNKKSEQILTMCLESMKYEVATLVCDEYETSSGIGGIDGVGANGNSNPTVVIIPTGFEGFHSHAGDSFRELAEIWAERNYVRLERSTKTPFCWLGGIGETLLYDRPNYQWLESIEGVDGSKMVARKKMLVGNPLPVKGKNQESWSFWARRPKLVEMLVEEGICNKGYNQRSKNLVFYGRVENPVQAGHRDQSWSSVCDEFHMPVGVDKKYTLSQEGYLRELSNSKFGLCLAGYGKKCHREVECMSMGTVPVVSGDVDMTGYANPPIEGIHYIRVNNVNDVTSKLAAIDESSWIAMSAACKAWWLKNASAKGMWLLTKELSRDT